MGDIHGTYKALIQCLQRSGFNYKEDCLVQLGDIADGFDQVYECVEELLKIKHLVAIRGNHDEWFNEFIQTGIHPQKWAQGAVATARSYLTPIGKRALIIPKESGFKTALNPDDVPETHRIFFREQRLYYVDEYNNCFVHAGFNRNEVFEGQEERIYYWDRKLWQEALSFEATKVSGDKAGVFNMVTPFNQVFIGHTNTMNWKTDQPMHAANIRNIDTDAGHKGRLTIMNVRTMQYWQSDPVLELYK